MPSATRISRRHVANRRLPRRIPQPLLFRVVEQMMDDDTREAHEIRARWCRQLRGHLLYLRRFYAQHSPELMERQLRFHSQYCRDVLAHTEPGWWLARRDWSPVEVNWLLPAKGEVSRG